MQRRDEAQRKKPRLRQKQPKKQLAAHHTIVWRETRLGGADKCTTLHIEITYVDEDGILTWEELQAYLKNDRVVSYMATHQIDVSDAALMFKVLDVNATGEIEMHEWTDDDDDDER